MNRTIVGIVCCVIALNGVPGADCDDLSFSESVSSATYCDEPVDRSDGSVRNAASGSALTCVGVYLAWCTNIETIDLQFGPNSASGDADDDIVATCTTIGAQGSAAWALDTTRADWCSAATAALVINYPCLSGEWWNHCQFVNFYDLCGSCE